MKISLHLTRSRMFLAGALLVMGSLAAACGDTAPTATTAPAAPTATTAAGGGSTGGATGSEIAVTLSEWSVQPAAISAAAGKQTFKVTNNGKFPHNFSIVVNGQEKKTPNLKAGETATLETDLAAGSYTTLCDLPGHADKGMKGTLDVK